MTREADYPRKADDRILQILQAHVAGDASPRQIARRFGINVAAIERIIAKVEQADIAESGELRHMVRAHYGQGARKSPAMGGPGGVVVRS